MRNNLEEIKRRFLKDDLPIRLGGIAANLMRIESFSRLPNNKKLIKDLIAESEFFIEWTAPAAALEIQAELANTQIQLALCNYSGSEEIAKKSARLAQRLLRLSGLLKGHR